MEYPFSLDAVYVEDVHLICLHFLTIGPSTSWAPQIEKFLYLKAAALSVLRRVNHSICLRRERAKAYRYSLKEH